MFFIDHEFLWGMAFATAIYAVTFGPVLLFSKTVTPKPPALEFSCGDPAEVFERCVVGPVTVMVSDSRVCQVSCSPRR